MPLLTAAERARRYRLVERLETALERLDTVVGDLPPDFDPAKLDIDVTLDFSLITALSIVLRTNCAFKVIPGGVSLEFPIPVRQQVIDETCSREGVTAENRAEQIYLHWSRNEMVERSYTEAMSKQQFAQSFLGATLKSPKWGWVAVREGADGEAGQLFLFCWEHDSPFTGDIRRPIRLFEATPRLTKNGTPHLGHQDAIRQAERAANGELTPHIVWMSAVDSTADHPKLRGYDQSMLTRCSLSISDDANWIAQPEDNVWPPFFDAGQDDG
jgi:hypothetical protein